MKSEKSERADDIFLFKVDPIASGSESHTAVREEVIM